MGSRPSAASLRTPAGPCNESIRERKYIPSYSWKTTTKAFDRPASAFPCARKSQRGAGATKPGGAAVSPRHLAMRSPAQVRKRGQLPSLCMARRRCFESESWLVVLFVPLGVDGRRERVKVAEEGYRGPDSLVGGVVSGAVRRELAAPCEHSGVAYAASRDPK